MKKYISIKIIVLISLSLSLNAQHNALVHHWNFDGDVTAFQDIVNGDLKNVIFQEGIEGKGVSFSKSNTYLEVKEGVDLLKDFTLSFWFKPVEIKSNQTLFYQFRQKNGDYNVRNFIRLEIEKETFLLKSEKGTFDLKYIPLKTEEWYSVSYMYDGTNTKLYLQGKLIYSTDEDISFYNTSGGTIKNRLFIGKSHTENSPLKGVIDDLRVFQAAIDDTEVAKIFEEHKDKLVYQEPEEKTEPNEPIVVTEVPEKKLDPEVEDVVYIDDYEVLEPLIVRTTGITLEYYQIKGDEGTQLTIVHNSESVGKPYTLSKKKQSKRIALNIGDENSLTFEGFQLKKREKCRVRVNIKSGRNIIASYDISLDKNNVVLPIAYLREKDKNPKGHKIVTVSSKNIKIQIKDNSKVDGDIITIKQSGTTILERYSLTDQLKTINVELKENSNNEFDFVPIDMGKASGENTALVLILVDDKVIYDFSLRSIDVNRPARLTIIHEEF